jgi:hypothetical protein
MLFKTVLAALLSLPLSVEDRPATPAKTAELESIAAAVHREARGDFNVAAMTLMLGWHESAFSSRIGRSDCVKLECDPVRKRGKVVDRRARGWFQMHRNGMQQAEWDALKGPDSADAQVKEAVRRVRSAFATCRGEPDEVQAAIAQYAGAGCKGMARVPKFRERVQLYYVMRRRIP